MSQVDFIETMVNASVSSLERGLLQYWPVVNPESNGIQEANLTLHLASVALNLGFSAFPEASNGDFHQGHSRADLLLINRDENMKMAILVEAKKLYSAQKATEMASDFEKMVEFKFVPDKGGKSLEDNLKNHKYGLLLAITQHEDYLDWWEKPYEYDSGGSWDLLKDVIKAAKKRGVIKMPNLDYQYVLYAIFQLPADGSDSALR